MLPESVRSMIRASATGLRRCAIGAALLPLLLASGTAAQPGSKPAERLVLQLKWLPQAQFAGYYVAQDEGFYRRDGLDVTIRPGGPDVVPAQALAAGQADVAVGWLSTSLAERAQGIPLVNIAQIFERPGYEITCRRDSGVKSPADFRGKTLGTWFGGSQYPFFAWMAKLGLRTLGPDPDVRVLHQGAGVEPLFDGQAACLSTMRYNEYWQLIDGGMQPADLVVLRPEDYGAGMLEDGLYALQGRLADATMRDRLARFVRASIAGWRYALAHRRQATATVLGYGDGRLDRHVQARMLDEIAPLIPDERRLGYLDPAAYEHTAAVLLAGTVDPVIRRPPQGAWTHQIWDMATRR
jgi:NitT/TauT family transport system substrate-binding protein